MIPTRLTDEIIRSQNMAKSIKANGKKKISASQLPTKKTINFAVIGQKPINIALAIPLIILIVIAAGVFSKFMVADPIMNLVSLQNEEKSLEAVGENYQKIIDENSGVTADYAHYSYTGMTDDELNEVKRSEIVDLIDDEILPVAEVTGWKANNNMITLSVGGITLGQVNELITKLESKDLVNYASITSATTGKDQTTTINNDSIVTAQLIIYLNGNLEGGDE